MLAGGLYERTSGAAGQPLDSSALVPGERRQAYVPESFQELLLAPVLAATFRPAQPKRRLNVLAARGAQGSVRAIGQRSASDHGGREDAIGNARSHDPCAQPSRIVELSPGIMIESEAMKVCLHQDTSGYERFASDVRGRLDHGMRCQ